MGWSGLTSMPYCRSGGVASIRVWSGWRRTAAGLSAFDVSRAQRVRNELIATAAAFFERFDLLLTPTMTLPPFPVGIDFPPEVGGRR